MDYKKPKAKKQRAPGSGKGKGGYMRDFKLSDELADNVGGQWAAKTWGCEESVGLH